MSQWVRHMSGQGDHYKVDVELPGCWQVLDNGIYVDEIQRYLFPKSQYALCDPPERWVDVSAEVEHRILSSELVHDGRAVKLHDAGYRLSRVENLPLGKTYFIVEKRES